MSTRRALRRAVLAASLVAMTQGAWTPGAHAQPSTTVTFTYTGAAQTWTVPEGVRRIMVDVSGAQGGGAPSGSAFGGRGGQATATLAVSPGETLQIVVGGMGGAGGVPTGSSGLGLAGGGGFNGGAAGGAATLSNGAGGGGGASDIRRAPFDLTSRMIVAGGGGGAGSGAPFNGGPVYGGAGGGLAGAEGQRGTGPSLTLGPGYGGGGGSGTAGGVGGANAWPPYGGTGSDGNLGVGGAGSGGYSRGGSGGGGGAGLFGGGGGSGGVEYDNTGGGGGGGSGFGPAGVVFQTGVHEGNGLVTITYDAVLTTTNFVSSVTNHVALRNDFSGMVGAQITVGSTPLTITDLGRYVQSGNNGIHTLGLYKASDSSLVASTTINLATAQPDSTGFAYAPLSSSVTLPAGGIYYVVSSERAGGDTWEGWPTFPTVAHTSAAAISGAVWQSSGGLTTANTGAGPDQVYVPVSFRYTSSSGPTPTPTATPVPPTPTATPVPPTPTPAPTAAAFVTGVTTHVAVRNNYTGRVGLRITVGASKLTLTDLGRFVQSGNSQTHTLQLIRVSDGAQVGTANVNLATATRDPVGFAYAALASPVTLDAGGVYDIVSQETAGGDTWEGWPTFPTVAHTSVATISGAVWQSSGGLTTANTGAGPDQVYVPVSFRYQPPGPPSAGEWLQTGSMLTLRSEHTATRLTNGKVLVSGGISSAEPQSIQSAEVYDPASGTWASAGSMSARRRGHAGVLLPNGNVLVSGGSSTSPIVGVTVFDSTDDYTPATNTWGPAAHMTIARSQHTATLLPNGQVLVAGGLTDTAGVPGPGGVATALAELYDPASGTWHSTGSMSSSRAQHTATLLPTGEVVVTGGTAGSDGLDSAELYNAASGTWRTTGSMSAPRTRHTATLLANGRVLVAGGLTVTTTGPLSSAELYDPAAGTWRPTGSMASPRSQHTATLLANGQVLATGGYSSFVSLTVSSTTELYDPMSGSWSATESMLIGAVGRFAHTATLLLNDQVLAAGGAAGNSTVGRTAELYRPR